MGKRNDQDFMHVCGVPSCRRPRVMGTGYCTVHATVESRAALPQTKRIWVWILFSALPGIWCFVNANTLDGLACTQVEFRVQSVLSGAFACLPETAPSASLFALFSAPGATTVANGLTLGGFGFMMLAIVASISFWRRDRAGG